VLFGTPAGFGGGFLLGYLKDDPGRGFPFDDADVEANAVILGGIGAGAGALVGAIAKATRGTTPSLKPMLSEVIDREVARVRRGRSLSTGGDSLAQQPALQNRGWIRRHPALFGTLVGAGAGVAFTNTVDNEWFCSGSDEDCLYYTRGSRTLVGAGMGAGVGALVGWLAGLGTR
jgi:hypothetical protein